MWMHVQHNLQILDWVSRCFCVCSARGFRILDFFRMSHDQWQRLFWSATERKKGVTVEAIEIDGNQYPKGIHHKDLWVFSQASNAMHSGPYFQGIMLLCCCCCYFSPFLLFCQTCLIFLSTTRAKVQKWSLRQHFHPMMLMLSTKSFHFSEGKYKGKVWN